MSEVILRKLLELAGEVADGEVVTGQGTAMQPDVGGRVAKGDADLSAYTREEIASAKAHVHADVAVPLTFSFEDATIEVQRTEVIGGNLVVHLAANVPTDGPYVFVNPPVRVAPDVDDPEAAFREMVGRTVVKVARRRSWQP